MTTDVYATGSHYDIGRQRFVIGRKGSGLNMVRIFEGVVHGVLAQTNILDTNITYTIDLANMPLWWLITRIQAVHLPGVGGGSLLHNRQPSDCSSKWAQDDWPWLWHLRPPYQKDAYDAALHSWIRRLNPLRFVPFVKGVVDDGLQGLLVAQVLGDRDIPESPIEPAHFCKRPADDNLGTMYYGYHSQSFQAFVHEDFRRLAWVIVSPNLQS